MLLYVLNLSSDVSSQLSGGPAPPSAFSASTSSPGSRRGEGGPGYPLASWGPSPALLALQQLAVGGDLHIQGQLGVHQILVVTQQPGQVLAGFLQSLFQLTQLALGVFEGILSPLLSICNGVLYTLTLGEK